MAAEPNTIEIYKILPKTNCGECGTKTCMAFAASVFSRQKQISRCPYLTPEQINSIGISDMTVPPVELSREQVMYELREKIKHLDLQETAERLGYSYKNEKISLNILGKNFSIDSKGQFFTDIHINPWVVLPVITHLINGKGTIPSGVWVSLRELPCGKTWEKFFNHKCELPLKRLADSTPDLFEDIIRIFNGKQVTGHHGSDIALVISPMPLTPILICYWKPEEGLASTLNIFFDQTTDDNLNVEVIYGLTAGLVNMFEKIARRHGIQ